MSNKSFKAIDRRRPDPAILLLGLSAVLLWFVSVIVLRYYAGALIAPGPNTVGEAGKVFFAQQFAMGGSIFNTGLEPPYYPSVHGALLHAVPGFVGMLFGADTTAFYYIGRAMSVGFTLATILVTTRILGVLNLSRWWIVPILLLLLADRHVFIHVVSYRPENWLLFFSAASCLILLQRQSDLATRVALAVLPVLAFYTKASALSLLVSVVLTLIVMRRTRDAWQVGAMSVLLILLTGFGLQAMSDGRFLAAFSSGASVGFSVENSVRLLRDPLLLFVVGAPILSLKDLANMSNRSESAVPSLVVFWIVGLAAAVAAATRAGSNYYYYLEPYFYGSLLLVFWLSRRLSPESSQASRLASATLTLLFCFAGFATHVSFSSRPDEALTETMLFMDERQVVADVANSAGMSVFSADPGLNVLLDRPSVVHPFVQTGLILGGRLSPETLLGPVERCEYARVYLVAEKFERHGIPRLPSEFFQAIATRYMKVPYDGDYLVYEPLETSVAPPD